LKILISADRHFEKIDSSDMDLFDRKNIDYDLSIDSLLKAKNMQHLNYILGRETDVGFQSQPDFLNNIDRVNYLMFKFLLNIIHRDDYKTTGEVLKSKDLHRYEKIKCTLTKYIMIHVNPKSTVEYLKEKYKYILECDDVRLFREFIADDFFSDISPSSII